MSDEQTEQGIGEQPSPTERINTVADEAIQAVRDIAGNFDNPEVRATAMSFERDFNGVKAMAEGYGFTLEGGQKNALGAWAAEGLGKVRSFCDQHKGDDDVVNTALSFERFFREIGKLAG